MAKLPVEITEDFISSQLKDPVTGLMELVDNALDADANRIDIAITRSRMNSPATVIVTDDGTGMSADTVARRFGKYGDSEKKGAELGPNGRERRGKRGRGRFSALGIGDTVVWATTSTGIDGTLEQVTITGDRHDLDAFDVEGPVPATTPRGTVVTISDVQPGVAPKLDSSSTRSRIGRRYALELARQQSLSMTLDSQPLRAIAHQRSSQELALRLADAPEGAPTSVTVVEWDPDVTYKRPMLVVSNAAGDGLLDLSGLAPAPFRYSAYLSWDQFAQHESALPLAAMAPVVGPVIGAAIDAVAAWVAGRVADKRGRLVQQWKEEASYPYSGTPKTTLEEVERDLFDVVATTASAALEGGDVASRKLSLALIREALRRDASEVADLLEHVLHLPAPDRDRLRALLARTSLSNVIATSQLVSDRLKVIEALTDLTTERRPVTGKLEAPVHELAAENPWLFGDAWALALSERGFTEVLRWHRAELGPDVAIPGGEHEAVTLDGHVARVDVLLSRLVENASDSRERLVVELKRPGLPLTEKEVAQIGKYAQALVNDGRFQGQRVRWEFVLVGSSVAEYAAGLTDSNGYMGNQFGPGRTTVPIRVVSWDTLLATARHRLKFVADTLQLNAETDGVAATVRHAREDALTANIAPTHPADTAAPPADDKAS